MISDTGKYKCGGSIVGTDDRCPLNGVGLLAVILILLVVPVALIAIKLAGRLMRKQAALLI